MTGYNAATRRDVRRLQKQARIAAASDLEIIRQIMATPGGREWVHNKLVACHVFQTSFATDALQMAFNEGARAIGCTILADVMRAASDNYVLMMREANERDAADAARAERDDNPDNGDGAREDSRDDNYIDYSLGDEQVSRPSEDGPIAPN